MRKILITFLITKLCNLMVGWMFLFNTTTTTTTYRFCCRSWLWIQLNDNWWIFCKHYVIVRMKLEKNDFVFKGIISFINYKIFIIHLLFFMRMLFCFFQKCTIRKICQDCHEQRLCKNYFGPCRKANICHNRHDRRWWTFFKLVPLLA